MKLRNMLGEVLIVFLHGWPVSRGQLSRYSMPRRTELFGQEQQHIAWPFLTSAIVFNEHGLVLTLPKDELGGDVLIEVLKMSQGWHGQRHAVDTHGLTPVAL